MKYFVPIKQLTDSYLFSFQEVDRDRGEIVFNPLQKYWLSKKQPTDEDGYGYSKLVNVRKGSAIWYIPKIDGVIIEED